MKGNAKPIVHRCEADVAEGLEDIASAELRARLGGRLTLQRLPAGASRPGAVQFTLSGDLKSALALKTVHAVSLVRHFGVPRPKAMLGDEHFQALVEMIALARSLWPAGAYRTLCLNAAGSDSAVMLRLKRQLAQHTGLAEAGDEGDVLVRIRRALPRAGNADPGWEVLVRLSPRPLATRAWRVRNLEGALNAAVAHAMVALTEPAAGDVFLNLACGSGTLLIERLAHSPARLAIGCDPNAAALDCARANRDAAGFASRSLLWRCDGRALPIASRCVDGLCADLPFGHLVGSHEENVALYPALLAEAARVARPGARFAALTHEVRLMESLLAGAPQAWRCERELRVELGGLYPRVFILRRV